MDEAAFRKVVEEEWAAVPIGWRKRVENVALLVEDEPSEDVRQSEGLTDGDVLLGIYQGIPRTERGEGYGSGMTMPDTITVYRLPTLDEAQARIKDPTDSSFQDSVRIVVRETIWHELGHYFGHDDTHLHSRENEESNRFS